MNRAYTTVKLFLSVFTAAILFSACDRGDIQPLTSKYFVKFFGGAFEDEGVKVIELTNGNYLVCGTYTKQNNGEKSDKDIRLITTDKYGNVFSSNSVVDLGDTLDNYAGDIVASNAGGYIIVGTSYVTTDTDNNIENDSSVMFVAKTTIDGDTIWQKSFNRFPMMYANSVIEDDNNNIIIGGYVRDTLGQDKNLYLLKIDEDGNYINEHVRGEEIVNEEINDLYLLSNGKYMYVANWESGGVNIDNGIVSNGTKAGKVVIVGKNTLNEDNTLTIGDDGSDLYLNGLYVYNDTTIYVVGASNKESSNDLLDNVLIKCDFQSSILSIGSINYYGDNSNDLGYQITETSDQQLIIAGTKSGNVSLIKVKTDGEFIWEKSIGFEDDLANDILLTSDNGFIVTGYTNHANTKMISLIKTNEKGELKD